MSHAHRASQIAATTFVLALVASSAAAQQPVASFDRLNTRLEPGDTVWVTDTEGREVKGKLRELSATAMRLDVKDRSSTFEAARVRAVRVRARDSVGDGIRWGALAGVAGGIALAAALPNCAGHDDCLSATGGGVFFGLLGGAAGAGVGAVVDAAMPGPVLTVYQTPSGSSARVSIAPFVSPRARGLSVTVRF